MTAPLEARPPTANAVTASAGGRIDALDAVRALALLGVLIVNVDTQFARSPFARFLEGPVSAPQDAWARALVATVLEERPLVVFSFLFGAGLAAGRTLRSWPEEARRLLLLLLLGAAHFVFLWAGDVLALYAVVGLAAAAIVSARPSPRTAILLALASFGVGALPLPVPPPFTDPTAMQRHVAAAAAIYGHAHYVDIVRFRLHEVWPVLAIALFSVPRTLALFVGGAVAWESGWLTRPRDPRFVRASAALALVGAVALVVAEHGTARGVGLVLARDLGETATALGAAGLAFSALSGSACRSLTRALAPIGRMTLTAYLTQSVVLGLVFYGYGAGAYERVAHAAGIALSIILFSVQLVLAHVWLARFALGPLEWAWRSASRGRVLPFARRRS